MLALPIYLLGSNYYLHTRINGKQVKKSLRTGYKRLAILRAVALLNSLAMPNKDLPEKYELDASRGIFKADGPEDHARLLEAIEALKTMQSGLPLAVAPAPATAPAQPLADDPTALRLGELAEKYFLLKKVKQATVRSYRTAADELARVVQFRQPSRIQAAKR